jgi:flagellar motility protein MotE (MotC chaperone)
MPRLLPLVGIAVGGVLAVKALADIDALPKMMAGAQALAEEAAAPAKGAAKVSPVPAAAKPVPAAAPSASAAVAAPIKVCAPSPAELARDAGLSPAELQVLQSLGVRRNQLDARETDLDTQLKLLAAAEAKLDVKLKGLNGLKTDLQVLLGQTEAKESAEIDRLVIVYGKMKPKDAAAVMVQLEDKVRIPVAAKLKESTLAAVLSQMPPAEAKKLTESLAHRYDKVQQLAQNATAATAASAAAPAAAPEADPTAPAKAAVPVKAAPPKPRVRKAAAKVPADTAAATPAAAPAARPAATPAAAAPAPSASAPAAAKPAA